MGAPKSDSNKRALLDETDAPCIAVIGMAGRFPGARSAAEFWRNIRDGVESITILSDEQLRAAGASPADLQNPSYVRAAAILDDIDFFDAAFFGLSPKDAAIMDPQHRLFLESAWTALENSGWTPDEFKGRIGVYAGSGFNSYLLHNLLTNQALLSSNGFFLLKQTGNDKDVLATRVSYHLNLTGPSITVQTACSTSLVAIHLACQGLLSHECDMALAGGVTIELPHGLGYVYRENEILSRDGHCRSFDANSTGTVFGSGLGIVVLRRLEDALRDGDSIRAIVRATAVNNDGARKAGFFAPSVAGQAEVVAEALAVAAIDARSISLIEAHGTGTLIGDPIEVTALTRAFGESTFDKGFCLIGSVKANVGHLDAAAGVAGFIKTVLALEHGQMPPSVNFSSPNPRVDFDNSPFFINTELREWKSNGYPRRAGVTSLGIGGTNAHVILEEAPIPDRSHGFRPFQLLTLSAKTPSALEALSRNLGDYLADNPHANLADVAFTLHRGRKGFPHRRALVTRDAAEAAKILLQSEAKKFTSNTAKGAQRAVVFLFSGQGAQYPGMGRELYETEPAFRRVVDHCSRFLEPHLGLDLRALMFPSKETSEEAGQLLSQTRITQPALFVIEYALARLWESWGIKPDAMIGHSIGEYAAACIAEVFSLETALRIVAERGRLMQGVPTGAMTAVSLPERDVAQMVGKSLSLASVNNQQQCIVSGPETAITDLENSLSARGITTHRLRTSHAFHSPMMDPILESFIALLREFKFKSPRIPYVSGVTGTWITDTEATDPNYWARQLRQTVRFADGMALLLEDKEAICLEVGPGHTLASLALLHESRSGQEVLASMRSQRDATSEVEAFLSVLGHLWTMGAEVDWRGFHSGETRRRLQLPTYPFERKRYWINPGERSAPMGFSTPNTNERSISPNGLFQPTWKRGDLAKESTQLASVWLIFRDSEGLGAHLAEFLRGRGLDPIEVIPGECFERLSAAQFQIDPGNRSDYDRLIADLQKSGGVPSTVVNAWPIMPVISIQPDLDEIEKSAFYSLLFLAQALGSAAVTEQIRVGVISNSLQTVAGSPVLRPERALLFGPCGVIPKEIPNIRCQSIDVVLPSQPLGNGNGSSEAWRELASQLVSELNTEQTEAVVAYRNNQRWIRGIGELQTRKNELPSLLRNRGVYLITGGLGGVGLTLARSLSKTADARLILVSRSSFPARAQWDRLLEDGGEIADKIRKIQLIEEHSGEVLVVSADVCDREAMNCAVKEVHQRFGRINGVIHAAGVLDDGPLLQKDPGKAAAVINPKLRGALVVEAVLQEEPLDFFAVISSVSATFAPAGQIDYAAANAFLDSFAQARSRNSKCPAIAIQFPRWRDVGMAARSARKIKSYPKHPLIGTLVSDDGNETVYSTTLRLERDWIVSEHRLKDAAGLFPGTGYIELVRAAVASKEANAPLGFSDILFKVPLWIEPSDDRIIRTVLRKSGETYAFTVFAKEMSAPGKWIECTSGRVYPIVPSPASRVDLTDLRHRCNLRYVLFADGENAKQSRHIMFGPRWKSLKRIDFGKGEALVSLELEGRYVGELKDYKFHPALLDMATGAAMFVISGYDASDSLYVPISYGRLTITGAAPARCYAHIRAREGTDIDSLIATFDINVLNESGEVVSDIERFSMRRLQGASQLRGGEKARQSPPVVVEFDASPVARTKPDDSISSADGAAAFERILRGEYAASVIVFPGDLAPVVESAKPAAGTSPGRNLLPAATPAPRNEVEATLANWWKELLGLDEVSVTDDFFALGGQSLTALRLFALITKTYEVEIGLPEFFNAPTIEKLATIIGMETAPPTSSKVLVELKQGGARRLFLVHDGEGGTLLYLNLARRMPNDLAVFGIEPRRIPRVPLAHASIEEMAAFYIEEVRKKQSHGPYLLGGLCAGAVIAYEMASQLIRAGESVELLALLDAATPNARERRVMEQRQARLKEALAEVQKNERSRLRRGTSIVRTLCRKSLNALVWEISHRTKQVSVRARFRVLRNLLRYDLAWPKFLPELSVREIYDCVQALYEPKPLTVSSVLLVRARTADPNVADDTPYQSIYEDRTLGWDAVARGLKVVDVDGGHSSMLQESYVDSLAKVLTTYVQKESSIRVPSLEATIN